MKIYKNDCLFAIVDYSDFKDEICPQSCEWQKYKTRKINEGLANCSSDCESKPCYSDSYDHYDHYDSCKPKICKKTCDDLVELKHVLLASCRNTSGQLVYGVELTIT
jgi:hypothetical protein